MCPWRLLTLTRLHRHTQRGTENTQIIWKSSNHRGIAFIHTRQTPHVCDLQTSDTNLCPFLSYLASVLDQGQSKVTEKDIHHCISALISSSKLCDPLFIQLEALEVKRCIHECITVPLVDFWSVCLACTSRRQKLPPHNNYHGSSGSAEGSIGRVRLPPTSRKPLNMHYSSLHSATSGPV